VETGLSNIVRVNNVDLSFAEAPVAATRLHFDRPATA